jgi:UDP-N-acetylmuramate dehydrogenase
MKGFSGFEEIVEENKLLSPLTTFRIGGPAEWFIRPRTEDELRGVLECCAKAEMPIRVLGNGSNILVPDEGVKGAVIQLDPKGFGAFQVEEDLVRAGASLSLSKLVREAAQAHLSGIESLVGIPGWVGGAVKMNAGGAFGDIGQTIERVKVMDTRGQVFHRDRDDLAFGYRSSNISARFILDAEMRLMEDDEKRIARQMKEIWFHKKNSQPMANRSAGCIFKNPRGMSAGALIDQAGLKGTKVGGAFVSRKHANYLLAGEGATAADLRKLIDLVRKKVHERNDIYLELEVEIW